MNLRNQYNSFLQRFIKIKKKSIHVEAIVKDEVWQNLKKLIGKGYTWFVITPANYGFCKNHFNIRMTKEEFTKKLLERIRFLKDNNEEIQLHIHFTLVKEFFDNQLQEEKFDEAMKFMSQLQIKPTKFVAGWYKYNDYTLSLAKKYGIKVFYAFDHNPLRRAVIKNGIIIYYEYKVWHDYDFI